MIVIKIEMWPRGDQSKAVAVGSATIANVTAKSAADGIGDYRVELFGGVYQGNASRAWKRGTVTGFDRKRRGAWDLLYQALHNTIGERT